MFFGRITCAVFGCCFAALVSIAPAHSASVSLSAVADSGLREVLPDESGGGDISVRVGTTASNSTNSRARALFTFDPTIVIPPGSIITSAQLTLKVSQTTDTLPRSFDLRRMLVPWAENDATWRIRLAPGTAWNTPGGAAGVDYAATASASIMVAGVESYIWGSTTGLVADVQCWLDNPSRNHGWMLVRPEESTPRTTRLFNSRENTSGQPLLAVEFTPPLRIISAQLAGNEFCLEFQAQAGQAYIVERRVLVDSGAWSVVTNLPPVLADGPVTVCDPRGAGNRFYRVGRQ